MPKLPKKVDIVFVHNSPDLLNLFSNLASAVDKEADTYHIPQEFLENIDQYPKHTKIILGRLFDDGAPRGIQMAEQLHALGGNPPEN